MVLINSNLRIPSIIGLLTFFICACSSIEETTFQKINTNYKVSIQRDFWGIPHIKGETDIDIAYGVGLVHAEDAYDDLVKLMPLYRGKNAVVNGLKNMETDYLLRLLKVHSKVNSIAKKQLSPTVLNMAKAYADGVNTYAKNNPKKVDLRFHPVTQEDIIAGSYIQHLFFSGLQRELEQIANYSEKSIPTGSNAIAINNPKSKSNTAFLLINSHQPLSGPVGWYELNIESKSGWKVHGGNFPGSFLINIGFNEHIGWGATVNRPDLMDIFKLTINPNNPNEYLKDGVWIPFKIEEDHLKFKLLGLIELKIKQQFKYSDFGPVLEINNDYFALKHSSENSFEEIEGWYELSKSKDIYEFEKNLEKRKIPTFNFVAMDSKRNIGYFYNGRIPYRKNAYLSRNIIRTSSSENIWSSKKLVTNLPKFINPANGWVQSTNQNPYSVMGEHSLKYKKKNSHIHYEQRLTNRSHVANEILSQKNSIDLDEFIKIKFDNSYSKNSRQFKFLKKISINDPSIESLVNNWDMHTDYLNTNAGLSICLMAQEWTAEMNNKPTPSSKETKSECTHLYQKIQKSPSEPWSKLNTISRNGRSYPIQGSVDTLRAVYTTPNNLTKSLDMTGGDGLFFIIAEQDNGKIIYGMHNYGSSRDPKSVHYSDQVFLFSKEALRYIPENL